MASQVPPRSPPEGAGHPGPRSQARRRRSLGYSLRCSRRHLPGRALLIVLLVVLLAATGAGGTAEAATAGRAQGGVETGGPEAGGRESGGQESFVPEWSWPLAPAPAVLRPFEKPAQRWLRGHRGVDLAAAAAGRAPAVLSPDDGVVSFAGTVVDRGVLSIDHGEGRISSFEPVTTQLVRGQRVGRGEVVATLEARGDGPPGHCPATCLHWGVRVDGEYVDPLSFVLDRRPSVLLPLGDRAPPRGRTVR
ncbi:M23 family metallopeptidase [Arthrobacter sp. MDT1-65]